MSKHHLLSGLECRKILATAGILTTFLLFSPLSMDNGSVRAANVGRADLSEVDLRIIIEQAVAAANSTASATGLRSVDAVNGPKRATKMHIAVVSRDGKLLAHSAMDDAWVGSEDIAIAKARTAAFFSSDENALTSRIIGVLSQAHNPDGSGGAGPLWGIENSNQVGISGEKSTRNGIIPFPGGVALYKNGSLVGGIGVSGDAVDQDEFVAFAGAAGFEPGPTVVKLGYTPPVVPQL